MFASISLSTFLTISSIRAGWILPSSINLSNDIFATSRLTGLKPESITASGVSSIIRSIPVAASIARMFRPSRPIIRPFISSFGRSTTDTVFSATYSPAYLFIASAIISSDFFLEVSLASFSILRMSLAVSCLASDSMDIISNFLASSLEIPATLSS